jgi:hypothetical protein
MPPSVTCRACCHLAECGFSNGSSKSARGSRIKRVRGARKIKAMKELPVFTRQLAAMLVVGHAGGALPDHAGGADP